MAPDVAADYVEPDAAAAAAELKSSISGLEVDRPTRQHHVGCLEEGKDPTLEEVPSHFHHACRIPRPRCVRCAEEGVGSFERLTSSADLPEKVTTSLTDSLKTVTSLVNSFETLKSLVGLKAVASGLEVGQLLEVPWQKIVVAGEAADSFLLSVLNQQLHFFRSSVEEGELTQLLLEQNLD